ncbi:GumC family protein [Altererythrobacter sp. B11]|uniref:GumC family protein n=1 Tax=Altererythrobacter sp. B11 TaxID=2060312 RepID=UPI001E48CEDE|nr:Wzz/FepE/Etk N-terminal domain-containing protein [Altererythrobacter sp. B11]
MEAASNRARAGNELHHVIGALRRHRWLIVAIVGAAGLAAALSQLLATPMYRSVATVQVELTDSDGTNQAEAEARNAIRVENQAKIYSSRAVAAKVVDDLDLVNDPQFLDRSSEPANDPPERARARAVTQMTRMIRVVNSANSDLLDIEVVSPYPDLAAAIANQYPVSAQEIRISRRQRTRRAMLSDLERESKRLGAKLARAEQDVSDFRQRTGMLEGAGSVEDLQQINRLAAETASARAIDAAASARTAGVSRAAGVISFASADSPLLQQQRIRRSQLQTDRIHLSSTFGAGHPQIIALDKQIAELDTAISREEAAVQDAARQDAAAQAEQQRLLARSESAAAAARAGQLQGILGGMAAKAYANNSNKVQLAQLERNAELARNAYMSTVKNEEEVRSALGIIGVNSTLISPAVAQSEPFYPKPLRTIVGAILASFIIALLMVFLRELLDDKLRSPWQIFRLFRIKTFGMFPQIGVEATRSMEDNPVLSEPESVYAEVARGAHAEVLDLAKPGKAQTVFVSSPLPGEGKATVAISLCAAAAAAGRRAVVVDFDLRNPGMFQEIQRQIGGADLVELLLDPTDRISLPAPERERSGDEARSYHPVIVAARDAVRNPATIFSQDHLERLFGRLHEHYDLVIVNGPAALAVQDARSLTRFADNILLVVTWGSTTVPQFQATMGKLGNRIDGVIFDRVNYAEHARRGYEDEVQYYMQSAPGSSAHAHLGEWIRGQVEGLAGSFRKAWARG